MEGVGNNLSMAFPSFSFRKHKPAIADKRPEEITDPDFLVVLWVNKEILSILGISNEDESFVGQVCDCDLLAREFSTGFFSFSKGVATGIEGVKPYFDFSKDREKEGIETFGTI